MCPLTFLDGWEVTCHVPPQVVIFTFCFWRGFKTKRDVCHVLCEDCQLGVKHSYVDVETEFGMV